MPPFAGYTDPSIGYLNPTIGLMTVPQNMIISGLVSGPCLLPIPKCQENFIQPMLKCSFWFFIQNALKLCPRSDFCVESNLKKESGSKSLAKFRDLNDLWQTRMIGFTLNGIR